MDPTTNSEGPPVRKACAKCHSEEPCSGYYKKQWKKNPGEGLCKVCWDNEKKPKKQTAAAVLEDIQRQKKQPLSDETNSKGLPVKKACAKCHSEEPCSGYYKKQWKKNAGKGLCKVCWDNDKKPKKRTAAVLEDIQRQKKRRLLEDWKKNSRKYFLTRGVSYEFEHKLEYQTKKLQNKDLEGSYDLVFYATNRICCDNKDREEVHRTATGWMNIRIGEWGGKPALVGNFSLKGSDWMDECDMNDWSSGCLAETVTEEKKYLEQCNGMNIIKDGSSPDNEKYFLMGRGCSHGNWYKGVESEDPEHYSDAMDCWCGAKISVVANKAALGLSFDNLPGLGDAPECRGTRPKDLQHAEELFDDYHSGQRHSWISRHLGLPSGVASIIGKFVAPPPVFFVQPGDLVLEVEESREPEWDKLFLFRKSSP